MSILRLTIQGMPGSLRMTLVKYKLINLKWH